MRDILLELEEKGVISKCYREKGDFVNTIFLREKRDSVITNKRYRLILNVKCLNEYVLSNHFKMETLYTCLQMMKPNCFMASLDLKDAYFSIPVHNTSTKYLKFQFQGQTYKFLALPQGFKDSPRVFTKIMKPVLAHLRLQGVNASIYIDDIFIQNNSFTTCSKQVDYTMKLIKSLGFTLSEKSSPIPNQTLRHLGFVLNSQSMTVSLAEDKKDKLQSLLTHMSHTTFCSIRDLAQLIGSLVATFPAVPYGPVFYRHMEMSKTQSLKLNAFNFDRRIIISSPCKAEINWWLNEGIHSSKSLTLENPSVFLTTDASTAGWGAHPSTSEFTQGFWSPEEQLLHINVLELKAVLMGLVTLCHQYQNSHILIHIDNTTAVSYINHMGGTHSINCNSVTKDIILWAKERNIWLTATHIVGKDNNWADRLSRKINDNLEWTITQTAFNLLCAQEEIGLPSVDLFASCLNHKLPNYVSIYPDASAMFINAFTFQWNGYVYLFPPFNLIGRVLNKVQQDRLTKALLICPHWVTQPWYPLLQSMLLRPPILLNTTIFSLVHPRKPEARHPLADQLQLMACLLSGTN